MFLVSYPISAFDEQMINHPDYFRCFDTTKREDSLQALMILFAQFGENLSFYDMTSRSSSSRYQNIDDFVNEINCEEFDFNANWLILLNIEEKDIVDLLMEYKRDFVIIQGNNKPLCYEDRNLIVYGDFEMAIADMKPNEKLHCLLSFPDKENENDYIVHDFIMEFEDVKEVGVFNGSRINDTDWFNAALRYLLANQPTFSGPQEKQQVRLSITADCGKVSDFLRELANDIECENQFTDYESAIGSAVIEYPND